MNAAVEIILAFLAGIGLLGLGWLLFGQALAPAGDENCIAVVPAKGDGERLEQAVMGLLWLRGGGMFRGTVVIADAGLTETGQAVASALALREPNILIYPCARLGELIENL